MGRPQPLPFAPTDPTAEGVIALGKQSRQSLTSQSAADAKVTGIAPSKLNPGPDRPVKSERPD
jgi:hypothetical protein